MKVNKNFFEEVSLKEVIISSSRSSNFVLLKNWSSIICFFDIFFRISPHLLVWVISKSISLEKFSLPFNSFLSSVATTLIVASGVPNECAAAAAWPPRDSNSYSLAITCCSLFIASDLLLLSPENLIPK